jgi:probable HAF family extracellular repeat protein
MKTLQLFAVTCVALVLTPFANANQHATIWDSATGMVDLGTLGGANSYATGINDSGQVVGYSELPGTTITHTFIWTAAGGMVDIGSFGKSKSSQGQAINSAGEVAGQGIVRFFANTSWRQPFFWSPSGGFVPLIPISQVGYDFAFGINDFSEVTGQFYAPPDATLEAFIWSPGKPRLRYIGALPGGIGFSVGNAISNAHHLTGTSSVASGYDAILWSREAGVQDIASIGGGSYTAGEAINDHDEIVGIGFDAANRLLGFYWSPSTGVNLLQTLGGIQSACFGINQSGAFAGYATNAAGIFHATVWSSSTSAPQDLGALIAGGNSYARAINNLGQVAGFADAP